MKKVGRYDQIHCSFNCRVRDIVFTRGAIPAGDTSPGVRLQQNWQQKQRRLASRLAISRYGRMNTMLRTAFATGNKAINTKQLLMEFCSKFSGSLFNLSFNGVAG